MEGGTKSPSGNLSGEVAMGALASEQIVIIVEKKTYELLVDAEKAFGLEAKEKMSLLVVEGERFQASLIVCKMEETNVRNKHNRMVAEHY